MGGFLRGEKYYFFGSRVQHDVLLQQPIPQQRLIHLHAFAANTVKNRIWNCVAWNTARTPVVSTRVCFISNQRITPATTVRPRAAKPDVLRQPIMNERPPTNSVIIAIHPRARAREAKAAGSRPTRERAIPPIKPAAVPPAITFVRPARKKISPATKFTEVGQNHLQRPVLEQQVSFCIKNSEK
jgi:hypothetical protein